MAYAGTGQLNAMKEGLGPTSNHGHCRVRGFSGLPHHDHYRPTHDVGLPARSQPGFERRKAEATHDQQTGTLACPVEAPREFSGDLSEPNRRFRAFSG